MEMQDIDAASRSGRFVILEDDRTGTYAIARWSPDHAMWLKENEEAIAFEPTRWMPLIEETTGGGPRQPGLDLPAEVEFGLAAATRRRRPVRRVAVMLVLLAAGAAATRHAAPEAFDAATQRAMAGAQQLRSEAAALATADNLESHLIAPLRTLGASVMEMLADAIDGEPAATYEPHMR